MIVTIDTNVLVKWFSMKKEDQDNVQRPNKMLDDISRSHGKLVIPTPSFAEFLVGVDEAASDWLSVLERRHAIVVAPFDKRAAFECGFMDKEAIANGDKKGGSNENWQKIKIDRQIIAIAKVNNSTRLVAQDTGLIRSAKQLSGMEVLKIEELELPDYAKQRNLDLDILSEKPAQAKRARASSSFQSPSGMSNP